MPGGGVALVRCIEAVEKMKLDDEDEATGVKIIVRALEEPLRQLAINAGDEGATVVQEVKSKKGAIGYNAETGVFEDLLKAGVIDPTKVTRTALQNASSVAWLLLTTEVLIAEIPEPEKAPAGGPGGGGDMY